MFTTYSDALTFVQNSFSADYEWGGNASEAGFASFLFSHVDDPDDSNCLEKYLLYVGENPADYI